MARVFSQEDGNLDTRSIITSRNASYSDIDLTFQNKPGASSTTILGEFVSIRRTDIFKKTDAAAVRQSVKNLLMTNSTEKPFDPYFGGDLNSFLFSLSEEFDEIEIQETIAHAITNFEPRAIVRGVDVKLSPDYNSVYVTVKFQVVNTGQQEEITVSLTRLR